MSYVTTQSEMDSQQSESTSDDINDHISSSESIFCDNGINFSQDTELDFSSGEEIQTLKQPEPRIIPICIFIFQEIITSFGQGLDKTLRTTESWGLVVEAP